MELSEIFSESFLKILEEKLTQNCINGQRFSKESILNLLDIKIPTDPSQKSTLLTVIGAPINLQLLPVFDCMPGAQGGIGVKGQIKPIIPITFPDNFINNLKLNLDKWFLSHTKCTREQVLTSMCMEVNNINLNFVSLALNRKLIENYEIKRGRGGIRKKSGRRILQDKVI